MNTVFMKRLLHARSNRMRLLAAGLVIALPMAACIALAQEPAASPSKMTTPEGYSAHHSVDVTGRMADKVGSGAMYDTLVNLQSGPRVSGETLELHKLDSNKHALVDDAHLTGSGFGGDPYNFAKLSLSKAKLYEFDGTFRRNRQYFDYNLLGNPNAPASLSLPIGLSTAPTGTLAWGQLQHSAVMTNSVRRMTDTNLTILPLSKFTIRLGYAGNVMEGPGLQPSRSAGVLKYAALLEQYQRHSTDEYTIALDWKPIQGTQLTYEQRIQHYKENSYFTLDPNGFVVQEADGTPAYLGNWDLSSNGSATATTTFAPYSTAACASPATANQFLTASPSGGKPIIDPTCAVVTSYSRTNPIRTTMPSETLRLQSTSIKNLIMNGEFSYSLLNMNMPNYFENQWGLNANARNEYFSASGTAKREVYSAQFGVIWQVTPDFDLSDQVTLSANAQPGNLNVGSYTKLATATSPITSENINNPTLTSTVTASSLVTGVNYGVSSTYFGNEQLVNNLTASWKVTPKANLALTYRYGNRNIGITFGTAAAPAARNLFAISEQGVILNAAYRVNSNWDINGTVEATYDDNAFTPMSPRQVRRYRLHTKFRPAKWANFTAAYNDMERHNNTNNSGATLLYGPLNHVDYSRTASISGVLTPNEHVALDFDYAYNDVYTATNICFANQDSGMLVGTSNTATSVSPLFAGAAFLTPTGAPSTCPTSATNATPTQWFARAFMDAPTQSASVGLLVNPQEKVKYGFGYRVNSVAGNQLFTDARLVNGALQSTYSTPYVNVNWTIHPGLTWKAEYNYFGYGEGGPSGAQNCTLDGVGNPNLASSIVPCATMTVPTGMNEGTSGATSARNFHANNISLGFHYEF